MISNLEVARIAQMAFILEPISNKPGLTTRYTNKNRNLKLENFLVAGLNIGDSFRELSDRISNCKTLPITYDIALQAQKDSFKNRIGTRLIYGGIISLFPIVITQRFLKLTNPFYILDNIESVLKLTHPDDTLYYQELENFAYSHSNNHKQYMFDIKNDYVNMFDYYEKGLAAIGEVDNTKGDRAKTGSSNKEILNGYPILRRMLDIYYNNIRNGHYPGISETLEEIDFITRREFPDAHPQWLADLHVCLLYLVISYDDEFFV